MSNVRDMRPLRRKRRIRARAFKVIVLVFIFTICLTFAFIYRVDAFRVKIVEVSGVERVSAENIYDNSKVAIGENLISLPVQDMRASILESEPLVKDAAIKRILPSRVKIEVYEREPFAYVTSGRSYYLIDRDRVVLEKSSGIGDESLFRVDSDAIMHAGVGERLGFPNEEIFGDMCELLDEHLKGRYTSVRFDQRGIKLFLKDGVYVLLGNGEDMEKKIMLVPIIIKKLRAAGEKFVGLNLEYLEAPTFIKKG